MLSAAELLAFDEPRRFERVVIAPGTFASVAAVDREAIFAVAARHAATGGEVLVDAGPLGDGVDGYAVRYGLHRDGEQNGLRRFRKHRPDARLTVYDLLSEARTTIERLSPHELLVAVERGDAMVLDIRDAGRVREGSVAGAIPVPRAALEWVVDPASDRCLPAIDGFDRRLVIMSERGRSSTLAAASICRLGHHRAADLIGGFDAWRRAGLPIARSRPDLGA